MKELTPNKLLLDTFYLNNKVRRLYLERTYFSALNKYQYFLKLYSMDIHGTYNCDGYIYFYLDNLKNESSFIGLYVKPEYRSEGLASLLTANYIKICMDYGFYNFTTSKTQRKPFLIYLLKKVGFEIPNPDKYNTSKFTIKLYQNPSDNNKYLSFKSDTLATNFMRSSIAQNDNYQILPEDTKDFTYLDQILQSHVYSLRDSNTAYTRCKKKIETYK